MKPMVAQRPLLIEFLPEIAEEVRQLLKIIERTDLLPSLDAARFVSPCRCGDDFCSSIYTAIKPSGPWGPNHETVPLGADKGMINLDIVEGKIVYVEILDRPDIRSIVDSRLAGTADF
jgi:hypothetical protein